MKKSLIRILALLSVCAVTVNMTGCGKKKSKSSDRDRGGKSASDKEDEDESSENGGFRKKIFISSGDYYFYTQTDPNISDLAEVCVTIEKMDEPARIGGYDYEYTYRAVFTERDGSDSGYVYIGDEGNISFNSVLDNNDLDDLDWELTDDGYIFRDPYITSTVCPDRTKVEWHYNDETSNSQEQEDAISLYTSVMREHYDINTALDTGDTKRGLIFYFEDVTDESCRVVWDCYAYENYGYEPGTNKPINNSLYGEQECSYRLVDLDMDGKYYLILTDLTAEYSGHTYYLRFNNSRVGGDISVEFSPSPDANTSGCYGTRNFEINEDDAQYLRYASGKHKVESSISGNVPEDAVEFSGSKYKLYEDSLTWSEAERFCADMGGHLASVNSAEEQYFLEDLTVGSVKENIWIGGYYSEYLEEWKWTDESKFDYFNWDVWYNVYDEAFYQPDNYTGDEFYLRYANRDIDYNDWYANRGGWNDTADFADGSSGDAALSTFGFVCEWS